MNDLERRGWEEASVAFKKLEEAERRVKEANTLHRFFWDTTPTEALKAAKMELETAREAWGQALDAVIVLEEGRTTMTHYEKDKEAAVRDMEEERDVKRWEEEGEGFDEVREWS